MTNKRVLIVDDNSEMRALIRMTLELDDYELFEAEDGDQALKIIPVVKPNVIILDIMMPGQFNGIDVCRKIKSNVLNSEIKVILLSAMGQKIDLDIGFEAGADLYIVKPFSPLDLLSKV